MVPLGDLPARRVDDDHHVGRGLSLILPAQSKHRTRHGQEWRASNSMSPAARGESKQVGLSLFAGRIALQLTFALLQAPDRQHVR
jgi:hypothetical protein